MESQKDCTENLRVASFSAYLNSTDDNSFLLKLTGAIPDPISAEVTPRLKSTFVRSKTTQEGEIGVFGADKYFNMKMDYYQPPKSLTDHHCSQSMIKQEWPKLRAGGTPSVTSEVSGNSQTALVPTFQENPPRIKPKKGIGKRFFTGFGCNGPCLKGVECGTVQRGEMGKNSFRFANPVVFDGTKDSSQSGLILVPDSGVEDFTVGKQLEEVRKSMEVFGADKYFNMKMDYYQPPKSVTDHHCSQSMIKQEMPKLRAGGTPSVTSEVSGNSQTALVPTFQENPPRIKPKKGIGKRFFTGFGCNGSCLKGVECGTVQRREMGKNSFRFANPVVFDGTKDSSLSGLILVPDSGVEDFTVGKQLEEARKSIEVFGSQKTTNKKGDIATNLERKLSVLTWDAIPKAKNVASTLGSWTGPIDDIQSDASSDLFEIETGHPLLTIQQQLQAPSDQISAYEPSEASIEWSVVTASAADYDEKMSIGGETRVAKTKNVVVKKKGQRGRTGAGLLSCRTDKAVSIDETAVRANEIKVKSMGVVGKPVLGYSGRKEFEFATVQQPVSSRTISP